MKIKKKILLIGFQKASLENFKQSISFFKKKKILLELPFFFKFNNSNKKKFYLSKINKDYLRKKIKSHQIILGTSETNFEAQIFNYFKSINYEPKVYIDSITNLKLRFKYFIKLPDKIIVNNGLILSKLKKMIKKENNHINYENIKMPYQRMLRKIFFKKIRENKKILYLSSDIGIQNELKNIKYIINFSKSLKIQKKIIISIHPRENLREWKLYFQHEKLVSVSQNKNYYNAKDIRNVYGVSTMGLINYKFCGFKTFFFKNIRNYNDEFNILLDYYNIEKANFISY